MTLSTASAHRKDINTGIADMQHRHFATVAAIIRDMSGIYNGHQGFIDIREDVALHFADALRATNPKFDRQRFLAACKGV